VSPAAAVVTALEIVLKGWSMDPSLLSFPFGATKKVLQYAGHAAKNIHSISRQVLPQKKSITKQLRKLENHYQLLLLTTCRLRINAGYLRLIRIHIAGIFRQGYHLTSLVGVPE
jgi:hypothetical protein